MIRTQRLDLMPCDVATTRAAIEDPARLGALLGARVARGWPPDLLDTDALEWTLRWLGAGNDPRWGLYWVVLRDAGDGARELIGSGGYKGAPAGGAVEIGYGIVAEHQRRGYATEAAAALVAHAFSVAEVERVIAETLPGLVASIGVMEKCGLRFIGDGSEPGVIRYERKRRSGGGDPRSPQLKLDAAASDP